jgi:hypothetical protein
MQKFVWSVLSALLAAVSVRAQSAVSTPSSDPRFYVQPSVIVAFPGDLNTAVGGAVAVGMSFARHHSVEVEGMYFESSDDYYKLKFTPFIATYKYTFPVTAKLSLYLGASLGVMHQELDYPYYYYSFLGSTHLKDDAVTGGTTGGLEYKFNPRVALEAGVKTLEVARTDFTSRGTIALLRAGLKIRF